MERQNITLSIPKNILRKAKILAVRKGTSISGLLTQILGEVVEGEEAYQAARSRHLAALDKGFNLKTGGEISWNRDELHER